MELEQKPGFRLFDLSALRATQSERLRARKFVTVPDWGMAVPIKKLTAGNLAEATSLATTVDVDTGKIGVNEWKKNIHLLLFSIEGMDRRDFELLEREPAGVIHGLLDEILRFSGFGAETNVLDHFEEEKKSSS